MLKMGVKNSIFEQAMPSTQKSQRHRIFLILVFTAFFFFSVILSCAQETKKTITFEQAYRDTEPRLLAPLPDVLCWLDDQHYLITENIISGRYGKLTLENTSESKNPAIYKVHALSGEKTLVLDLTPIQNALPGEVEIFESLTPDQGLKSIIFLHEGDLYYIATDKGKLRRLTRTQAPDKNPRFSPDGRMAAFTREHNLFTIDIEKGREYQLTSDGSETVYNGWASWVYYEEILERESRYVAFWWSPDSKKLAFLRFDDSPVPTFPLVAAGNTHGKLEIQRYPKSGDPNPEVKLGVVPATGGKVVWTGLKEKADHYIAWPFWFTDSSRLTFQWMNREQTNLKIYAADLNSGNIKEIYDEKQSDWVEFFKDLYFLQDGSGFLLRSDIEGWKHLYHYDLNGRLKKRITSGGWAMDEIYLVDEKYKRVFFSGWKDTSTETHLFVVNLDGTGLRCLTEIPGTHSGMISPAGTYIIDTYSNVDTPSQKDLLNADGRLIRILGKHRSALWDEYTLAKKALFTIPTQDGWNLPAYWILPPDFDEKKKYPVLFNIYSGPDDREVTNSYPPLPRLYIAQEGIIIFCVDHRGSGHVGKKGVALMHRNLGKWEMHDLIEAVKWLHKKPFIDKTKIGITGSSYGGYTTCMAMTYGADYFTHGYAKSSVTDWHLYDSVYTERYMDRPFENEHGYEFGSVMTHAHKLKGVLCLTHGDMDDNVHMQNSIQLMSKLINLGKKFEFMLYPNQRHRYRGKEEQHSERHYVDFWFRHFLNR